MRTARILLLAALATVLASSPAQAVVRQDNGRFVFAPYTRNNDPVSIIEIGGRSNDRVCNFQDGPSIGKPAHTTACMSSHIQTAWRNTRHFRKGLEMKERSSCNGHDRLDFYNGASGIENIRSTSTSSTCEDQFHVRMWGDYAPNPFAPGQFSIMSAYYEVRGDIPRFLGGPNHEIDQSWEDVENTVMYEMRHSSRGEDRYCGQNDYRPVPGQTPGTHRHGHRDQPLYNNARLSRISIQKPDYSKPTGHHCDGA